MLSTVRTEHLFFFSFWAQVEPKNIPTILVPKYPAYDHPMDELAGIIRDHGIWDYLDMAKQVKGPHEVEVLIGLP